MSVSSIAEHGAAPEPVEALAGLAVAALSHAVAVIISRRHAVEPARILPALRPTPEELVLVAPLCAMLLNALPKRARLAIVGGVLVLWFASRIALAVQAARVPPPKPTPWWRRAAAKVKSLWR